MNRQDLDYYRRREHQERESAMRTDDVGARRIHIELADRYRAMIQKLGAVPPAARA